MTVEHPIIGILGGTGKEGTGLAARWAAVGFPVVIGSRQAEKAQMAAAKINQQLGITLVSGMTNWGVANQADICILTVIAAAHREAVEGIKGAVGLKFLVDATSRVDFQNPLPPSPPSAAQEAQAILGSTVKVSAAFQNVPAKSLRQNIGQSLDTATLVCSDDVSAAEQVIQLAQMAGIQGYYAGPLVNANIVEGMTSILISMNKYYGVKDAGIRITGIAELRK